MRTSPRQGDCHDAERREPWRLLHGLVCLRLELRLRPVRVQELNDTARDPGAVVEALVDNHRRFLAFLERRVGSRAVAEDLLQEAFVRGIEHAPALRRSEAATAWFYRILRNALVDHFRKQHSEERALAAAAAETPESVEQDDEELRRTVCECITALLDALKPEYSTALRRVELDGVAVRQYADEAGITPNNAAVRLHRARESLRRQVTRSCGTCAVHGCEDCSCAGGSCGGAGAEP